MRYLLSLDAEADLTEIARYTLSTWGEEVFERYRKGLQQALNSIGDGSVISRSFSQKLPSVLVTKYQYHFIFYLQQKNDVPIIIGLIHEKRDIVALLTERLTPST